MDRYCIAGLPSRKEYHSHSQWTPFFHDLRVKKSLVDSSHALCKAIQP